MHRSTALFLPFAMTTTDNNMKAPFLMSYCLLLLQLVAVKRVNALATVYTHVRVYAVPSRLLLACASRNLCECVHSMCMYRNDLCVLLWKKGVKGKIELVVTVINLMSHLISRSCRAGAAHSAIQTGNQWSLLQQLLLLLLLLLLLHCTAAAALHKQQ
jgi:hypothetical protein